MKQNTRYIIVVALLTVAVSMITGAASMRQTRPDGVIAQPDHWVAFEADSFQTQEGFPDLFGHYWRSSDGSYRSEQYSSDNAVRFVMIRSVSRAAFFMFDSFRNKWVRRPAARTGSPRIGIRRVSTRGLSHHPEMIEGFDIYQYIGPDGSRHLQAPALNFFALVEEFPDRKERRVLSNIKLVEPPTSVFEPPAGVSIEEEVLQKPQKPQAR